MKHTYKPYSSLFSYIYFPYHFTMFNRSGFFVFLTDLITSWFALIFYKIHIFLFYYYHLLTLHFSLIDFELTSAIAFFIKIITFYIISDCHSFITIFFFYLLNFPFCSLLTSIMFFLTLSIAAILLILHFSSL